MYGITKHEMKYGEYILPERTRVGIINRVKYREINTETKLYLRVPLDVFFSRKEIRDEYNPYTKMVGIVIETPCKNVFLDAGDPLFEYYTVRVWEMKKIFGEGVPKELQGEQEEPYIKDVVEYLEDKFANWVHENCEFRVLKEPDIDEYERATVGDRVLTDTGYKQFEKMKSEYQQKIETIGFTYDFTGGLTFD